MKKKILFSFIFIFVSLFFTTNVRAWSVSGDVSNYLPTYNPNSYPGYFLAEDFYDSVRDILFDKKYSELSSTAQSNIGNATEYKYMFALANNDGSRTNRVLVYFTTAIPTFIYDSVNSRYNMTLPVGSKIAYWSRIYQPSLSRYDYYYSFTDEVTSSSTAGYLRFYSSNYGSNAYITNTNNFDLPSDFLGYFSNVPTNHKVYLTFNYETYKYYNYFYLDNTLVYTNACGEGDLTVGRFYSCPFNSDIPIEANKVVSIMRLSQSYMPNGWDYNNLGWSDTTDKYYNSMIGGIFPQNSKIEEISFVSSSDSSVLLTSNILDVQYTDINSPTYHFNLFSSAISWNDTTLSNYDLIKTTISFPTIDISSFDVWEEGFNKLSDNYIADNISTTNNAIQEQILGNLNGNTVSTDNYFNFFNNFQVNNHSLSGFITLPLQTISHLSDTCSIVSIPFPMMPNFSFTLPCMSAIYSQYLGNFFTMYQLIINGIISYYVGIGLFKIVKNTHDPKNDSIEVVDL